MKINTSIESYNIKALSEIDATVTDINNRCSQLEAIGQFIQTKLAAVSSEFDNVNYERAQAAINSYIKKLAVAQTELTELSNSVKAFKEKIAHIWS